jgi:hypothetical protein
VRGEGSRGRTQLKSPAPFHLQRNHALAAYFAADVATGSFTSGVESLPACAIDASEMHCSVTRWKMEEEIDPVVQCWLFLLLRGKDGRKRSQACLCWGAWYC